MLEWVVAIMVVTPTIGCVYAYLHIKSLNGIINHQRDVLSECGRSIRSHEEKNQSLVRQNIELKAKVDSYVTKMSKISERLGNVKR